jgi:PGF-pre-PGF domain-containing protein
MGELDINRLKLLLLAFLVTTISSCVGTATEINVQSGGSIQAAVDSAHSGDTIIVEPGNYVGNIDMSKANELDNLVLMSASGNPTDTTITAANSAPASVQGIISITKSKTNITVKGFTISGARDNMAGVYLENSKQCTIDNNVFMNDGYGVKVYQGSGNVVSNNIVNRTKAVASDTTYNGINIENAVTTKVSQNKVSNQAKGIYIKGIASKGSSILENSANNNADYGILVENSRGITVDGNNLNSNSLSGIYLSGSSENYVTNNNIVMPGGVVNGINTNAIELIAGDSSSDSNVISNNIVSNGAHGIFVNGCQNNTVQNNRASGNNYGIAMRYSKNNRVINNNADGNTNGNNSEGIYLTLQDSGNTITGNSASNSNIGIHLSDTCGVNNLVDKNVVNSNQYNGIYVEASSNKVSNNSLSQNSRGIFLTGSTCYNNVILSNTVKGGSGNGIYLLNTSGNNQVKSNSLISNGQKGIDLYNSNNSFIDSNNAQENDMGIQLEYSNGVTLNNNTAHENRVGLRLFYSDDNILSSNNATYSHESGIDMNSARNNTIAGNFITWNNAGITMCPACQNNLVYNDYFNNYVNTGVQNGQNTWFKIKTRGKNILGGPFIGGNFWASPDGDGFSQTATDTNGDGIADTLYIFTNSYGITITDSLPLVSVLLPTADFSFTPTKGAVPLTVKFTDLSQNADSRVWNFGDGNNTTETNPAHTYSTAGTYTVNLTVKNKNDTVSKPATITVLEVYMLPVVAFTANPTSGDSPLTVQFTDSSQNAAGWKWDFGDGATSTDQSPSHAYSSAGTYNVNLVVSNENGTSSASTTITAYDGGSSGGSSHSSSGGGGGGAGGSPEPQNNVEIKELSQAFITSGSSAKFDFPQKVTPVETINFDSKKTVGKTTTIVETLKNKSTLVSGVPSDEIYKYLNIWVGSGGYATEKNIENATVDFKVTKSWVQDKGIDKSTISLNRYSDNTWNQLPTSLSSEDDNYLYLTAKTPGFSPFAITGKSSTTGAVQPSGDKTQNSASSATQSNAGNGNEAANTGQTPKQKENPSPSPKQSTSLPGFEAVFGVAGLVAVFMYRKKDG